MALVLGATGYFVYARLAGELDRTLDSSLRSRAEVVRALVGQADTGLREAGRSRLEDPGDSFAQVLDRRGRILDGTAGFTRRPVLDSSALARARRKGGFFDRSLRTPEREPVRLLAVPVNAQGQRLVVVVGVSRD